MANAQALINEGLWRRDKDFQKLPRMAQCTYIQILSQKDLDTAGVLTLYLELLAKVCDELTTEQLQADFAVLEERRFVFVDYDTDELFIRSYARLVSAKSPNAWLSVPKNARMIASEKIRRELAAELRRIKRKDAADLAAEIDPDGTPLEPLRNPIPTPSEGDNPSEPGRDPRSLVPVLVPESLPVSGNSGEGRRPECRKHEENFDGPCLRCKQRREWDDEHAAKAETDELNSKRQQRAAELAAIADCQLCDEAGWLQETDDAVTRCDHPEVRHA